MTRFPIAPSLEADARVILVGNPNVGKSALFGALTGHYVEISNFPGTTVELSTGHTDGMPLVDTPGIQSLHARSDDERVTRDILLERGGSLVLQVADARNLRRSLLLTMQLAELDRPLLLDVNMVDEARGRGIQVDTARLEQLLGAQVVGTVAVTGEGIGTLRARFQTARPVRHRVRYDAAIEEALGRLEPLLEGRDGDERAIALMILAGDEELAARCGAAHRAEIDALVARTSCSPSSGCTPWTSWSRRSSGIPRPGRRTPARPWGASPCILSGACRC
jgi:ferrous iron transport protein B